jgi:predicted transcriptional regulator
MRRVSVTLRIDSALWDRFRKLETLAVIKSRSQFLEEALSDAVHRAEGAGG